PKAQQDALAGVLDEVGWVQEVIVNRTTGHVVDGHLRVSLAISREELQIPVKYVELTPEEEALVLATLDPLARMAATAKDALEELLADVKPGSDAVTAMLEDVARGAGLNGAKEGLTDPDAIPAAEPIAKRGDVWVCGDHRVMCGDSTDVGDVARLMAGEKAGLYATDPPYGIAYDSRAGKPDGHQRRVAWEEIEGDDQTDAAIQPFLEDVFGAWLPHLRDNAAWYLWHGMLTQAFFATAATTAGLLLHRQIIWRKPRLIIGRGDYHWQHELCFYGWRKGNRPPFYGERNQTSVWEVDYDGRKNPIGQEHPTQKPVALWERPIANHLRSTEIAADPFLGSGTTMIAAERLGRRCYGMEIEPRYVDVAVKRWEEFTGRKAERGR
ncbi:hypothetical protein LCGC14_2313000, partial [marine sediment metagenome]